MSNERTVTLHDAKLKADGVDVLAWSEAEKVIEIRVATWDRWVVVVLATILSVALSVYLLRVHWALTATGTIAGIASLYAGICLFKNRTRVTASATQTVVDWGPIAWPTAPAKTFGRARYMRLQSKTVYESVIASDHHSETEVEPLPVEIVQLVVVDDKSGRSEKVDIGPFGGHARRYAVHQNTSRAIQSLFPVRR